MKTSRLVATLLLVVLCTGFFSCGKDETEPQTLEPTIDEITISSENSFNFTSDKGEKSLSFSTNKNWIITVSNTINGESWCSVTSISGKAGSNNVQIRVTENTGYDDRNVSLTIQVGSVTKTIIVTQKQKDALTLTTDKFEVGKTGGTINVEVKSNIIYEVNIPETSKSWIKQSAKTRGLTTKNLTFDIAANEEYEKREGKIIIQSGKLSETVHVYQTGEGILLLTKNEYPVSDKGKTIAVEIKSNFDFDVQMPNVDWVQNAAKTRGMSSHTIYYTISPNETYDSREAEIVFFDKNSSIKDTLKIIQAQKDAIIISKKEYRASKEGEIITIEFSSNINYNISLPTDCNWISIAPNNDTRGLEKHLAYLKIEANTTADERNCNIIVFNKDNNIRETIVVTQNSGGYIHVLNKLYEISGETTSINIDIDANVYYNVTIPVEYEWIKKNRNNGNRIYFDIENNYSQDSRTGYIIIESWQISQKDTIKIIQSKPINWLKRTLNINTAGTLENLINTESLFQINELTIIGNLNDDDILLLNDMTSKRGNLSYLNISETNITKLRDEAFSWSLTNSSEDAFKSKLVSIILPSKCQEIGIEAFYFCKRLKTIVCPNTITKIGERAFAVCENLKSVILPQQLSRIEENTFSNCLSLSNIEIPKSVTHIKGGAFGNCISLKKLNLPTNIEVIESGAFGESGLESIDIPKGITELSDRIFLGCESLIIVKLPSSLLKVGNYCFQGCNNITDIYCNAIVPPTCNSYHSFYDTPVEKYNLHIPLGSYTAYRYADGWNKFKNIIVE